MATNADLAAILRDVLREGGGDLLADRSRLQAALREKAPGEIRDINLLLTAYDSGLPDRLQSGSGEVGAGELGSEANQLVDQFGAAPEFARRAVEIWAMALSRMPGAAEVAPSAPGTAASTAPTPEANPLSGAFPPLPGASVSASTPVAAGGGLAGLPPLPEPDLAMHEPSVLAGAGPSTGPAVQVNPGSPAQPSMLPTPPELPVPSPSSIGPIAKAGGGAMGDNGSGTELPPVQPMPSVQPLPVRPLPTAGLQPLPGVLPLPGGRPCRERNRSRV